MNNFCECGCGKEVTYKNNRFLHGHHRRNIHHSKKTKLKISSKLKGKIVSKETREKLSHYSPWCKGKKLSLETRNLISKNHSRPMLGRLVSEETR